jgi:hypothetical protein
MRDMIRRTFHAVSASTALFLAAMSAWLVLTTPRNIDNGRSIPHDDFHGRTPWPSGAWAPGPGGKRVSVVYSP